MGWQVKRIDEVSKVVNGGTPKTKVDENWGGPHRWITPAEMGKRSSPFVSETARTLSDTGLQGSSANLIPPGSIILSTRAPIGHLVINTEAMAFNQGCRGLVTSDELDYRYLYYFLLGSVRLLNDLGTGATFKELSASKLKSVSIPLPPLPEQKQIVAILDKAFAAIDQAVANAERNLTNARELFESYLNRVFTERGEGWVEKRLDEVCENLDSQRIPITKNKRTSGDIPYYGASGIVDYVADYIFDEELLLVSEDGANLLARTYPIAFSVSGKTWVNNHAHVLQFESSDTLKFVEYYLNSISLEPYVSGMAQPKLNQKSLNSILISLPTEIEKHKIIKKLDELVVGTTQLETIYQKKLTALTELKQSILQKAFRGELTAGDSYG